MIRRGPKPSKGLGWLAEELVEDILATSDQEILAEFSEGKEDAKKASDATRAILEKGIAAAKKRRLHAAQAALAASRRSSRGAKIIPIADARKRLSRILAACPPEVRITIAARNESELTDADVLGMLQDLEELGIAPQYPESGERS